MNIPDQPVPSKRKTGLWIGIAAGGILACVCVLAIGLALGLGLGGKLPLTFLASPTPLPTFTPTARPTDTPMPTPTDTATPIPLPTAAPTITPFVRESLDTIIVAVKPAAQGNSVPEAGAYDSASRKIHPMVYISPRDQDGWNASLPTTWQPLNVGQVELVAVVRYINVEIEKARYTAPGQGIFFISRIRVDTEVILREAQTGISVASMLFKGGEPPLLAKQLPLGTTALYGTTVAYETVQVWLKSYVEP